MPEVPKPDSSDRPSTIKTACNGSLSCSFAAPLQAIYFPARLCPLATVCEGDGTKIGHNDYSQKNSLHNILAGSLSGSPLQAKTLVGKLGLCQLLINSRLQVSGGRWPLWLR
jgi:hypothetical protein